MQSTTSRGLLANALGRLSELLYLSMPSLPTDSQKFDTILIGAGNGGQGGDESDDASLVSGGKWEDEEERRFFEDLQDLKDFVPASVLGIECDEKDKESEKEKENAEKERAAEEAKKLQEELEVLKSRGERESRGINPQNNDLSEKGLDGDEDGDESVHIYYRVHHLDSLLFSVRRHRRLVHLRRRPRPCRLN
jgi:regulator of nonsense transcripts 2